MNKLLSPKSVCEVCAISRATLDRMVKAGSFPAPIKLTERRLAFDQAAVAKWIESKLEAA